MIIYSNRSEISQKISKLPKRTSEGGTSRKASPEKICEQNAHCNCKSIRKESIEIRKDTKKAFVNKLFYYTIKS